MKVYKIGLVDFWRPHNVHFWKWLFDTVKNLNTEFDYIFEIEEECVNPDLIIFSCFGNSHTKFSCKKMFYSGENWDFPDSGINYHGFKWNNLLEKFQSKTYSQLDSDTITLTPFFQNNNPNHYRVPPFMLYFSENNPVYNCEKKDIDKILKSKLHFCNFVYSNGKPKCRNSFFEQLSKQKFVMSGGSFGNNIGKNVCDKLKFIEDFKFTIAFENSIGNGYTTEKLLHPMMVNSLSIYCGNPVVDLDFNSKSFINAMEYDSIEELVDVVIDIDNSEDLYLRYLSEPYWKNNVLPDQFRIENFAKFILSKL